MAGKRDYSKYRTSPGQLRTREFRRKNLIDENKTRKRKKAYHTEKNRLDLEMRGGRTKEQQKKIDQFARTNRTFMVDGEDYEIAFNSLTPLQRQKVLTDYFRTASRLDRERVFKAGSKMARTKVFQDNIARDTATSKSKRDALGREAADRVAEAQRMPGSTPAVDRAASDAYVNTPGMGKSWLLMTQNEIANDPFWSNKPKEMQLEAIRERMNEVQYWDKKKRTRAQIDRDEAAKTSQMRITGDVGSQIDQILTRGDKQRHRGLQQLLKDQVARGVITPEQALQRALKAEKEFPLPPRKRELMDRATGGETLDASQLTPEQREELKGIGAELDWSNWLRNPEQERKDAEMQVRVDEGHQQRMTALAADPQSLMSPMPRSTTDFTRTPSAKRGAEIEERLQLLKDADKAGVSPEELTQARDRRKHEKEMVERQTAAMVEAKRLNNDRANQRDNRSSYGGDKPWKQRTLDEKAKTKNLARKELADFDKQMGKASDFGSLANVASNETAFNNLSDEQKEGVYERAIDAQEEAEEFYKFVTENQIPGFDKRIAKIDRILKRIGHEGLDIVKQDEARGGGGGQGGGQDDWPSDYPQGQPRTDKYRNQRRDGSWIFYYNNKWRRRDGTPLT